MTIFLPDEIRQLLVGRAGSVQRSRLTGAMIGFVCGVLAMVPTGDARADEFAVYPFGKERVSYAFGKKYTVHITEEMVQQAPQWLETCDSPPLSPRKALQVAIRHANMVIGNRPGYRRYLEGGVCLTPAQGGWVWVIRFQWERTEGGSTGIPHHLVIVILMDGSAVQPQVRNWNDGDAGG